MRILAFLTTAAAFAQPRYDLLLKNGHVIDPAASIDGIMDVAIYGGQIAAVSRDIPAGRAVRALDVSGLYVTPGLIDLHTHVFGYSGSIFPDDSALPAGTTTVVDAGGAGWRTFDEFRDGVMRRAQTRVLAWINIVGHGMIGQRYEDDITDMDAAKAASVVRANRDRIVGIKTAHFGGTGWAAIDRAIAAGELAGVPVMIDDRIFTSTGRNSREKLRDKMRPGDLHTHMYNDRQLELIDRLGGKVQPYAIEARRRGVLFDMGHGAGSFLWPVAARAVEQGFVPDTISTDLHSSSIMIPQSDMPNCMSKLMTLGMKLQDAVARATMNPAKAIRRFPELGTMRVGGAADIAVFELRNGVFAYKDAWHHKLMGTRRLECALTIRNGRVVFDRDARAAQQDLGMRTMKQAPARRDVAQAAQAFPHAEVYDLLIRNGHVIDPKNGRNGRLDIAVAGEKILRIGRDLRAAQARKVVDAAGYFVTPGLIDLQVHLAVAGDWNSLNPEHNTLPYGVTTAVSTGSAIQSPGTRRPTTRLLVPLGSPGGPVMAAELDALRAGDIAADSWDQAPARLRDAQRRGVLLAGGPGLRFEQMEPAIRTGVFPDVLATGLSQGNVLTERAHMTNVMTKMMAMGMTLEDVIERATANAAKALRRTDAGSLDEGGPADIAIFNLAKGRFALVDATGAKITIDRALDCILTIRGGDVVWDANGLSLTDWRTVGPYSNFR